MKNKRIKRLFALVLSFSAAVSVFTVSNYGSGKIQTSAAPTYEDYQRQIADLESQERELDAQIAKNAESLADEQAKQEALRQKISTIENKISTYEKYSKELEKDLAETDAKIRETQANMEQKEKEIKAGISDFKSRLRAMYVSGSESYTQVLLESEDFYDILMRFELVKRVAKHDNDTIDKLLDLKKQYENAEKKYQEQKKKMEETAQKYAKQLSNLSAEQSNLEALKAESEANAADIQSQNNELNNQRSQVSSQKAQAEYNATTTTTTTTMTTQATTAYRPRQGNYSNNGSSGSSGNSSTGISGNTGNSGYSGNSGSGYSGDIGTVIAYAKSMVGGSYVWGGSSYRATDCSGLVMLSYAQVGISLPHNAAAQAGYGKSVSYDSMQPGDLIFFGASIYHVAMYIGDGMMVHAENSSTGIVISYVSTFSQYNPITAIRRIIY